jgi:hypothetical protein
VRLPVCFAFLLYLYHRYIPALLSIGDQGIIARSDVTHGFIEVEGAVPSPSGNKKVLQAGWKDSHMLDMYKKIVSGCGVM